MAFVCCNEEQITDNGGMTFKSLQTAHQMSDNMTPAIQPGYSNLTV